jgi:hypothetical protein
MSDDALLFELAKRRAADNALIFREAYVVVRGKHGFHVLPESNEQVRFMDVIYRVDVPT